MRNSRKVALCGVLAALSTVLLFLTGVLPTATVAIPALAGCLVIPVVAELGKAWGVGFFAVCGLLGLLAAPDREAALIYLLFFGYYPVLKPVLERFSRPVLRWIVKLLVFNAAAVAEALLTIYVLGIPWENIGFLGQATPTVLLLLANVVFVLYDFALNGVIAQYLRRFHGLVQRTLQSRG